jgi:site-specific recombinase XerD
MLMLLSCVPLRITSLARMEIGVNVIPRRRFDCRLRFDERLQGRPVLEIALSQDISVLLWDYIKHVRPKLTSKATQRLWISIKGEPLSYGQIMYALTETTRRILGVAISPGLIRRAIARSLLTNAPEAVSLLPVFMSYSNEQQFQEHKLQAEALIAQRRSKAIIGQIE